MEARYVSRGLMCACVTLLAVLPALSQEPGSALQMTAAARSAATNGNYREAFERGMAVLEAHPESAWERSDLRRLVQQVSDRWFEKMSRSDQQAAVAGVTTTPNRPGGRVALAYANRFLGNRVKAVAGAMSVINSFPDSVGADLAIEGVFQTLYYDRDRPGAVTMVKTFANAAPNNPATGWALCRLTWWNCKKGQVDLAKRTNREIAEAGPNTRIAGVATDLNVLLEHLEKARYAEALDQLDKLREYTPESVIQDILDTFLIAIDWRRTAVPEVKARLEKLDKTLRATIENTSDPLRRDFALCLLGRRYMREGRPNEAMESLQGVLDGGGKILEEFALTRIARLCRTADPERAIRLLKRYRSGYGKSAGAVGNVMMLGNLYIKQEQYDKGLQVFEELESRLNRGEILVKGIELTPRTGMMVCLDGLARHEEADALASQLLQECRYGDPLEQLNAGQLITASKALTILGKREESKAHLDEWNRRYRRRFTTVSSVLPKRIFAQPAGPGSVSGVVQSGGTPVSGAIIGISSGGQVLGTAVSDRTGNYSIDNLVAGTHDVSMYANGYATEEGSVVIQPGANTILDFSPAVEATITGKVTKSDGTTPVARAIVLAEAVGAPGDSSLADGAGIYVVTGLSAGTYTISGVETGFVFTQGQEVSVSTGQNLTGVDLVAENGGIAGTVTRNDGTTPIEGAAVIVEIGGDIATVTFTDAGGNYTVGPLLSGSYTVRASLNVSPLGEISAVSVVDGQTTQGQDIAAPGGSISGTVSTTGTPSQPIAGVELKAIGVTGMFSGATTDATGLYTIESLPQGEYQVIADKDGIASGWIRGVNVVTNQNTGGQDFSLSGGGTISGRVIKASGGLPIEGAGVSILPSEQGGNCCDGLPLGAFTDSNGDYVLAGVSPDTYYVIVQADGYRSDSLVGVVVTAGQSVAGQDFSLGTTGGAISGTVYQADGTTPIPGAALSCFGQGLSLAGTTTDAGGTYRLELLEAGDYTVVALADGFDPVANDVTVVGTQETSGNDFQLPPEQ